MSAVHPFLGRSLPWLLRTRAEATPDKEWLVWRPLDGGSETWTYRRFADAVEELAAGLEASGIGKGDRVVVHQGNRPEFLLTWFALARLGAVLVSTNARSSVDELADYIGRSRARLVVTDDDLVADAAVAAGRHGVDVVVADLVGRSHAVASGARGLSEYVAVSRRPSAPDPGPEAEAGIQFTSGTSARPKGVVWTHANFLWAGKVSAANEELRADDRHLTYLPLFHTNAQSYSVLASLWAGGTVILLPRFSASRFWPIAVEEGATWCSTIPFAIRALRSQPVPAEHSFRAWGTGVIVESWERAFGIPTVAWWGMTETISHPIVSEVPSPRRHLAMGVANPAYELRIVDERGQVLPESGSGVLQVRGRRGVSMALGYLDDAEADAAAWDAEGWFDTGDRVRLDPDGWFTFLDREKDVLRVGAENVAASEVEAVVARVRGVQEAAVVGAPDPMLDEVPAVFVVPVAGADHDDLVDRILDACREQLADFKIPRRVFVVEDLPRSTLEKVAKAVLREMAIALVAEEVTT